MTVCFCAKGGGGANTIVSHCAPCAPRCYGRVITGRVAACFAKRGDRLRKTGGIFYHEDTKARKGVEFASHGVHGVHKGEGASVFLLFLFSIVEEFCGKWVVGCWGLVGFYGLPELRSARVTLVFGLEFLRRARATLVFALEFHRRAFHFHRRAQMTLVFTQKIHIVAKNAAFLTKNTRFRAKMTLFLTPIASRLVWRITGSPSMLLWTPCSPCPGGTARPNPQPAHPFPRPPHVIPQQSHAIPYPPRLTPHFFHPTPRPPHPIRRACDYSPFTSHKAAPAFHAAMDEIDGMDCAGRGVLRGCLGLEGAVLDGLEADGGGDAEDFVVGGTA